MFKRQVQRTFDLAINHSVGSHRLDLFYPQVQRTFSGLLKLQVEEREFGPLHPGEVLLEEFLIPLKISQHQLALAMRVAQQKINDIARGKRSITPDTALRLAAALGTTPEFWLGLQQEYDLDCARGLFGESIQMEVSKLV